MRILIDLDRNQISALDSLAKVRKTSRAALMRNAIKDYIDRQTVSADEAAFGSWRDVNEDGVEYQQRIRGEW